MKLIYALILGSLAMAAQENTISGKATYRERMDFVYRSKLTQPLPF